MRILYSKKPKTAQHILPYAPNATKTDLGKQVGSSRKRDETPNQHYLPAEEAGSSSIQHCRKNQAKQFSSSSINRSEQSMSGTGTLNEAIQTLYSPLAKAQEPNPLRINAAKHANSHTHPSTSFRPP